MTARLVHLPTGPDQKPDPTLPALEDFRDLRRQLKSAEIAGQTLRDASLAQHRRDQATVAHARALERMADLLDRLGRDPITPEPGAKPTLDVIEDMLVMIAGLEARSKGRRS